MFASRLLIALLLIGLLTLIGACESTTKPPPPPPVQQVSVKHIGLDDGLPSDDVYDIFTDSQNKTWISTSEGVAVIDGENMTVYKQGENGPPQRQCRAIYEYDSKMYVGTWGGGVGIFDGATWSEFGVSDGLVHGSIFDIAADDSSIWFATIKGVTQHITSTGRNVKFGANANMDRWSSNVINMLDEANTTSIVIAKTSRGPEIWFGAENQGISVWRPNMSDGAVGISSRLIVNEDYQAYVTYPSAGLRVLDVSNDERPNLIGTFNSPGEAAGVRVDGDLVYLADGSEGLHVLTAITLTQAVVELLGTLDTPGVATDVIVSGDYAYVADGPAGLQVVDISISESPTLVGSYDTPGFANDVAVQDTFAYVADGESGLQVFSINDPSSPVFLGNLDTPGYAQGIAVNVANTYVYVADGVAGVHVINISNPADPQLTSTFADAVNARSVEEFFDLLFVSDYTAGFHIVNVINPSSPSLTGSLNTSGSTRAVAFAGEDFVFLADYMAGVQIVDKTNPFDPMRTATHHKFGETVYYKPNNSAIPGLGINDLLYDNANDLFWVALKSDGLAAVDVNKSTWRSFKQTDGLPSQVTYSVDLDSKGIVWVGTQEGFAYMNGDEFVGITEANGLPSGRIRKIHAQNMSPADDRVWMGFINAGAGYLK